MQSFRSLVFALLALLPLPCLAQAPPGAPAIAQLEWMAGSWVQRRGSETIAETWLGPGGGMLAAVNLTTLASGKATFEFLRIVESPAGLSYLASPGGRTPVEFKLKEMVGERVVFENAQHDFPQRVLYWRDGAALMARIEGNIGGKERSKEWRFEKR